jgi:nucleotide-binding universal stress UspA family protein
LQFEILDCPTVFCKKAGSGKQEWEMRILIGYDGSECADMALLDLQRAGLPTTGEALVLTVADVFLPPPINEEIDNTFPMYVPAGVRRAHEHAAKAVVDAGHLAERANLRLRTILPDWDLRSDACADSPGWALIWRANDWKPDQIVVGSHGHTTMGRRLRLRSVAQRVLYEAPTSVRVARGRVMVDELPVRIAIGMDGSPDSHAVIEAVASRSWPTGSEVLLVTVVDTIICVVPNPSEPSIMKWFEIANENDLISLRQIFEASAESLREVGLDAAVVLTSGNPKLALIEKAEEWKADSLFVGARGMRGIDRFLLGSVSATAAARAHCSVEVVRRKTME